MTAEHPKLMKSMMRKYEDESEEANEALKKIEDGLKAKFRAAKRPAGDDGSKNLDNKRADYMKALKDPKDPIFTAEEPKSWTEARDRPKQVSDSGRRYRPLACSLSDVDTPPLP